MLTWAAGHCGASPAGLQPMQLMPGCPRDAPVQEQFCSEPCSTAPRDVQSPASGQHTATGKEPACEESCELCRVTLTEAKPTASKAQFPSRRDINCGWICHSQPACVTQACGGCQSRSRSDPHSRSPKAALKPLVTLPKEGALPGLLCSSGTADCRQSNKCS